ncbi:MAG: sugar phosphate nucleotidyltransferase [Rhabdochlamydiaceae bacterium]|nr:sugar phosphate nucleotidyltransferase [Candidatus Amphrikana amoebophyrae]
MTIYSSDDQIDVASIILAGGKGTRLHPLTQTRCKPDVLFGGRYRLIDIPISSSINSNINNIFVISQYLSSHLNQHIKETYSLSVHTKTKITALTPEEKTDIQTWYNGTADAVRKNLEHILEIDAKYYLILSGDHLYSMDLRRLLRFADAKDADLTIASIPICKEEASRMGLLKINSESYISDFFEKPTDEKVLERFKMPKELSHGSFFSKDQEDSYLASMGIYVFKRKVLVDLLEQVQGDDFGHDIIPHFVGKQGKTAAYIYNGYWEDIGTISSYYRASMELLSQEIGLNFYNDAKPIYSQIVNLPCPLITDTVVRNSIICDGSIIKGKEIINSMIGLRAYILEGSIIKDSIIMGNPHYMHEKGDLPTEVGHFTVGQNCYIEKAIIDEGAQIGHNVRLVNSENIDHLDCEHICIRDGIIIVKAGAKIPDHTTLDSLAA